VSRIFYIARHGETVFNAAGRMQGDAPHTPLTRAGFAQAEEMGRALLAHLGRRPSIELWASPAGRALQTLALLAEHLELDWHGAHTDRRLREMDMGEWGGLYYRDIIAEAGPIVDRRSGSFSRRPPGGECLTTLRRGSAVGSRNARRAPGERLVIMHGVSSRVLRGMLTGACDRPGATRPWPTACRRDRSCGSKMASRRSSTLGTGTHGASRPAAPA
jgi:probable phosphoglycerate mutase